MKSILFTCLLLISTASYSKQSAADKGHEIAKKNYLANKGYIGEKSVMELSLIDSNGVIVKRKIEGKRLETTEGDRILSKFVRPLDVKGTKLLTWSHKEKDDDQWLFLPSLKRVRRITSSNRASSFMGSEFSYEDFSGLELDKFRYKYLREEKDKKGNKIFVYESVPLFDSGYSKQIVWSHSKINNPIKIEFYDKKNELLKVATFKKYKSYLVNGKKLYRANKIQMSNVQTRKKSIMSWQERKVGVKISKSAFTSRALKK